MNNETSNAYFADYFKRIIPSSYDFKNKKILFEFCGQKITADILKKEKWLRYLFFSRNNAYNLERVNSIDNIGINEVLSYVERTLQYLDFSSIAEKNEKYRTVILKTLMWSEAAKGGTHKIRK